MTFKYTNLVLIFGNLIKTYAILIFSVVVSSLNNIIDLTDGLLKNTMPIEVGIMFFGKPIGIFYFIFYGYPQVIMRF